MKRKKYHRTSRVSYKRRKAAKGIEFTLIDALMRGLTSGVFKLLTPLFRGFNVGQGSRTSKGEKVKSIAEKRIANYLAKKQIRYVYEYPVHIRPGFTLKPDFYLPDYNLYIEYWGLLQHPTKGKKYRKDMLFKKNIYQKRGMRVIDLDHTHHRYIESSLAGFLKPYTISS